MIRVPAYSVGHSEDESVANLLNRGFKVIHVDRDSDNYLTLILHNQKWLQSYICKIWDKGLPPQNAGCFFIRDLKDKWE